MNQLGCCCAEPTLNEVSGDRPTGSFRDDKSETHRVDVVRQHSDEAKTSAVFPPTREDPAKIFTAMEAVLFG